jgi:hypothetical protein
MSYYTVIDGLTMQLGCNDEQEEVWRVSMIYVMGVMRERRRISMTC